jgi:branched-chain amino acid aminotransferase
MSAIKIEISKVKQSNRKSVDYNKLKFGDQFCDHMFECEYRNGKWGDFIIRPYGPVGMMPSANILHYGQGVFEGMKAFRYKNGKINIFRPGKHYERFSRSCSRMNIPEIPEKLFMTALRTLVDLDRDWVPEEKFKSLYIRPFVVATDEFLGLKTSETYKFIIISGPVGNYYSEGIKPVKLTTMPEYVRAVKGGVGDAKVPGNYAASLLPAHLALKKGYTQVMWLDAVEHKYVEEVGSMNMFFVIGNTVVTPPLGGTILPGVTRKSIIELCSSWGIPLEERRISIDELIDAHNKGILSEAFGSGTAAVVSPVGLIHHDGYNIELNREQMGPLAQKLYDGITSIHHGETESPADWCMIL